MSVLATSVFIWLSTQPAGAATDNSVECSESAHLSASAVLVKVLSEHGVDEWPGIAANVKKEGDEFHVFFFKRPKQVGSGRYYVVDLCGNAKFQVPLP